MTWSSKNDTCSTQHNGMGVCVQEYPVSVVGFALFLLASFVLSVIYFYRGYKFSNRSIEFLGIIWTSLLHIFLIYRYLPLFGVLF